MYAFFNMQVRDLGIYTWNHIIMYELLVLDRNTWNQITEHKLFVSNFSIK